MGIGVLRYKLTLQCLQARLNRNDKSDILNPSYLMEAVCQQFLRAKGVVSNLRQDAVMLSGALIVDEFEQKNGVVFMKGDTKFRVHFVKNQWCEVLLGVMLAIIRGVVRDTSVRTILTGVKDGLNLTGIFTVARKKVNQARERGLSIGPNTSSSGKNNMERNFPMDGLFIT